MSDPVATSRPDQGVGHAASPAGADRDAIERHYDVGDDFYACWLDSSMTYSAALDVAVSDSLEDAQRTKNAYLLDQARMAPGGRLLDVGCGWGSLLAEAQRRDRDAHLVGLTLSASQASAASRRLGAGAEIRLESYLDHQPVATYDAITSIGAFEHFAGPNLNEGQRVEAYAGFFERCFRWLPEGGRLCLQTIALDDDVEAPSSRIAQFFTTDIFPQSCVPRLKEIVLAADPFFRLEAYRADAEDYALTCRAWRQRLMAQRDTAVALAGRATFERYRKYLLLSELQFRTGGCTLLRLTLTRRRRHLECPRPT